MTSAIIYTSNTGFTKKYAELLGQKTGLPAYPLKDSAAVEKGAEVIYLGWLRAGTVVGYKKAAAQFNTVAVCGVGMAATGSQTEDVRKTNSLDEALPVFTLQGGFDVTKLRGIYKFMMTVMINTAGKALANKQDRTEQENDMLDLLQHGGDRVSCENLTAVLDWFNNTQK